MSNTNCLKGIWCPKCGQEDRFIILGLAQFDVTDDGSEAVGDHEWDQDSPTRCHNCEFNGKLREFRKLPPDPEGMNDKRAAWAGMALEAFRAETGTDEGDALVDLLCDLMHWCDRNNHDMDAVLERARGHYEAETTAELTTEARRPL